MVSPFDMNVLGGYSVVLKTGGEPSIEARTVKNEACLRGCIGPQPSSGNFAPRGGPPTTFYARRPTTRMGVEWVFRKTYYDLLNAERLGTEVDEATQAQFDVLKRTLAGELPVVLKAKATQDVRTAIYLKEEFGIPNMILDAAAEAWKEPELVQRSGVGLILPPYPKDGRVPDGTVNDSYFFALDSAAKFHAMGVTIALSGAGAADVGERMGRQAGFAMRGGLPFDAALAAVTINPARMLGVDDRVGSIEVGKDADLVLWSGTPFEPTSAIIGVVLDGVLVVDPRSQP
jgi:imidazolonepropionase-like amidohydrolase